MNKFICVSANAQNGKDTVANYLVSKLETPWLNNPWRRVAFASNVKKVFKEVFDKNDDFVEKWKVKSEIPENFLKPVRQSLQFIGDGFREIQSNIWVELLFQKEIPPFVISDGRYIGEAQFVSQNNGINILLYRPGYLNDDSNPSESQLRPIINFCANNIDEGPMPNFSYLKSKFGDSLPEGIQHYDYFLVNNESIQDLYDKIDCELIPYLSIVLKESL